MHWGQVNLHHFGAKGTALAAGTLEVTADSVGHALRRGLAEHVGCGIGVHKDVHERLQGLDLAARLAEALEALFRQRRQTDIAAGFTTAI